ncbi:MAG: hypothetical protein KDA89_21050 [Planctomycetaceae bacterium]|nr:hypothetical protein [Planctomycetaceae bacterium]
MNGHDVENAAWHFLCVAQQSGIKAAREALIPIETSKDTRVPMAEVYEYYAGRKSAQDVLDAADKDDGARAKMYAELYLGLLDEVADRQPQARQHLANAAKVKMEAHYMQDVAKVHVRLRKWNP